MRRFVHQRAVGVSHERGEIPARIALYRRLRSLLHSGDPVRGDHPDPAWLVAGDVSTSADHGVVALAAMDAGEHSPPGRVLLPGLADDREYEVALPAPGGNPPGRACPPWMAAVPLSLPGSVLSRVGLRLPALWPEQAPRVEASAR